MAPKSKKTRAAPYDPELLENWTLARLKTACLEQGISFASNVRRFALVKLLREKRGSPEETGSTPRHSILPQGARSQSSVRDVSQDGGPHGNNNLAAIISTLAESVTVLTNKVDSLETKLNSVVPLVTNPLARELSTSDRPNYPDVNTPATFRDFSRDTGEYSLSTAYSRFHNFARNPPSAAAGSVAQLETPDTTATRTTFGYAAHTLPLVETVSQALRNSIITDDQIPGTGTLRRPATHTLPPHAGADDGLSADLAHLWDHSLSKSTLATYKSALSCFLSFLAMRCLVAPWISGTLPVISEDILLAFVTFCQASLNFRFDTIKLYLAGIRYHYIRQGQGDPLSNSLRLPYILRAVKRTQNNIPNVHRLPITFPILSNLCTALHSGVFTPFVDLMLACTFKTAFYGFLRCGEFTCRSFNGNFVKVGDIVIADDKSKFSLRLRSSKTDPFGKGVSIFIFENKPLYPVDTMHKYLTMRHQQGADVDAPLFLENECSYRPLTRTTFLCYLKDTLSRLGYEDRFFSGHSFRIGACTSGAAGGVEGHVLQVLGRWKSDCFTRYIHTHPSTIKQAQENMNISESM
ncbi:uncharacterized protein LOC110460373 [Mizuhopecten yessoensis]|uniref:uncharacterized protein LOC110460373 n=1 Tax=Mizuhopecten yessoensis TaxID=6573 RepID=UPI000B45931B|nr:uncharacterized protein LOC110460373 [Mizuhopecten yessoensis]